MFPGVTERRDEKKERAPEGGWRDTEYGESRDGGGVKKKGKYFPAMKKKTNKNRQF